MNLDPTSWLPLLPVLALLLALMGFCLVDIIRRPRVAHLPRAAWALIVILVIPLGPILYLLLGRRTDRQLDDTDLR